MKVKITRWTAVAAWRWDVPEDDDICGICRVQFDATCPTCKFPGDDCPLLAGKCQHRFHKHCISMWINSDQGRGKCPMCRQRFEAIGGNAIIQPTPLLENTTGPVQFTT